MFSRRTRVELTPNGWSRAVSAARRRGQAPIDLTVSNPTTLGFPYDEAAIVEALGDRAALVYEPEPRGIVRAREALAARFPQFAPERTLLTASTSEAYSYLFKLLADPGDEVLVAEPSYPLLGELAALEEVRLVPYSLAYDGEWHLDRPSVRAALGPRTRAICVVHPNNPTGSFITRDERDFLASLGLPIVSDEVFVAYRFEPRPGDVDTLAEPDDALVFVLSGLSKLVGLPQLKLGFLTASGPAAVVEAALGRLERIADAYLSVGSVVQAALPTLLDRGAVTRDAIRARTRRNRDALAARVRDTAVTMLRCDGGWYAMLRLPRLMTDEAWSLALLEAGVLVQPGYFYDVQDEAMLVVSLLPREPDFDAGVSRLLTGVAHEVAAP